MIVRKSIKDDIDNIIPNEFFNLDREYVKYSIGIQPCYTLEKDGEVMILMPFFEFFKDCYKAGLIISKNIDLPSIRFFKKWLRKEYTKIGAIRLETEGLSNPVLERWHNFLGLEKEVVISDGKYIKWRYK